MISTVRIDHILSTACSLERLSSNSNKKTSRDLSIRNHALRNHVNARKGLHPYHIYPISADTSVVGLINDPSKFTVWLTSNPFDKP